MPQVGSLYTSLTLESQSFMVGLKRAAAQTQSSVASIEANFNKLKNAAQAAAAALALDAVVGAASRALDYASSLGEVSQQLGVTARDLQVYRYAATQAGISQEDMDKALQKLTVSIGKAAAGSKAQVATFREMGVSITDANGKLLTAGEIIPRIADALAKVKDPATRARLEVELFGKAGQKLDTLLAGGSGEIDNLRKAAEHLGIVLSEDAIANADKTADKLAEVKLVLEANIANVVAQNAGSIYDLGNSLISLASSIPNAIDQMRAFRHEAAIYLADQIDNDPLLGWLPQSIRGTKGPREEAEKALREITASRNRRATSNANSASPPRPSVGRLPTVAPSRSRSPRVRSGSAAEDPFAHFHQGRSKHA